MSTSTGPARVVSGPARRSAVLTGLRLGDRQVEERFDRIARLAARLIGVPMAMVNLVGEDQWTKGRHGIGGDPATLGDSICRHVVEDDRMTEIPDLVQDARFAANRFVTQDPRLRFYAGRPLSADGVAVGTLCVMDTGPRTLTADQRALLDELGSWAEAELNDVAANRLAEHARAQDRRARAVLDATPEGVLLVGRDGLAAPANATAEQLFGRTAGERTPVGDLLPGCAVDALPFHERRGADGRPPDAHASAAPRRVELTGRGGDGATFPVEVTVADLDDPDARWLVLVRDLRATQDVDARLHSQERLTRLLLASAADGIVGSDGTGTVIFANRAATHLLRCRESDLVGRSLHEVAHHSRPDGSPFPIELCPTHAAIAHGTALAPHEDVFWRRDGVPVPIEISVSPLVVDGERRGAVSTFRDISERREVDRLKAEFVGVVSHELRTPLTAITGSLRLLEAGVLGPVAERQRPMLSMAVTNAQRLGDLVDDILDMDRLDAGRMPLRPEPVDGARLVRDVVAAMLPAALDRGVRLTGDAAGPAPLSVDPHRMTQALTNLVGNALKFTDRDGEVTVIAATGGPDGREVHLVVRDTGRGIPPDRLDSIFDRFTQVGTGDEQERRGTGLGLAITRGIVERSGGRIEVRSELGAGSEFRVVLPGAGPAEGEE